MKSGKTYDQFNQLVKWFSESSLKDYLRVEQNDSPIYDFAVIQNEHLLLGFCNSHDEDYPLDKEDELKHCPSPIYVNGRVCYENYKIFDKWRNCYPPIIFLPKTKKDFDELMKHIEYVMSPQYLIDANLECDEEFDVVFDKNYSKLEHLIDESL